MMGSAVTLSQPKSVWDKLFKRKPVVVKPVALPVSALSSTFPGTIISPVLVPASVPVVSVFSRPGLPSVPAVVNSTVLGVGLESVHDELAVDPSLSRA